MAAQPEQAQQAQRVHHQPGGVEMQQIMQQLMQQDLEELRRGVGFEPLRPEGAGRAARWELQREAHEQRQRMADWSLAHRQLAREARHEARHEACAHRQLAREARHEVRGQVLDLHRHLLEHARLARHGSERAAARQPPPPAPAPSAPPEPSAGAAYAATSSSQRIPTDASAASPTSATVPTVHQMAASASMPGIIPASSRSSGVRRSAGSRSQESERACRQAFRCSLGGACAADREEACPLCLDEFRAGQPIRTLPCFHMMHQECAELHFGAPRASEPGGRPLVLCPVCRVEVGPASLHTEAELI